MTFKPLPILSLFTVLSLAMLVALGNWQYGRFTTKRDFDGATKSEVQSLSVTPLVIEGREAPVVYGLVGAGPVWRAFVPVRETGGEEIFFVDWLAQTGTEPKSIELSDRLAPQALTGRFLSANRRSIFAAPDQPEDGVWFSPDLQAKAAFLGLATDVDYRLFEPERLMLILPPDIGTSGAVPNPYFAAGEQDDLPPSRHLGYAITWWGLAAGLIAVYIAFHMSRGRLTFRRTAG